MKPLASNFLIVFTMASFCPSLAQQVLRMSSWEAKIEPIPGDPCSFKFTVETRATGPGTVFASANGDFSLSGSAGSISGSLHAEASGQVMVTTKRVRLYRFPSFGRLSGEANGTHSATNGSSSDLRFFLDFVEELECEYFAIDPVDPCELIAKHKSDDDPCPVSPLVLDLDRDGFNFGGPATAVHFDIYGSGSPIHMHWVTAHEDDAFLVLDANNNGLVDDGSELFGNGTRMLLEKDRLAPNGFIALGQYDMPQLGGNNDGFIDHRDKIWSQLSLWLDDDADGISTFSEMISLDEIGLHRLETIPRDLDLYDAWGNWLPYWATALTVNGHMDMVDVFFRTVELEPSTELAE